MAHPAARPGGRLDGGDAQAPPPALPATGTSFRRWAQALGDDAQSPERLAELPLWTAMTDAPALSLIDGALDPARDLTGSARELTLTLPPAVTGALLTRLAAAFHAGVNDVLLTGARAGGHGLVPAARPRRRAPHAVLVDVEGHGREEMRGRCRGPRPVAHGGLVHQPLPGAARSSARIDAHRTLDLDDALAGGDALGGALKAIKEQLRALPDNGLGYGLLRYLNPQTAATLAALPAPQIGFNYLGRLRGAAARRADWASAPEAVALGRRRSGAGPGARRRDQCADARRRRRAAASAPPGRGRRR